MPPISAVSEALDAVPNALIAPNPLKAVAAEARAGLISTPKTLAPWLFYDETGSHLFEQITQLPEYYLTRTERSIFLACADEIVAHASRPSGADPAPILTLIELGAGTATKTGILLSAAVRRQGSVVYQPVDVSQTALAEATDNILSNIPGVTVRCQVADYTREPLPLNRLRNTRTLALYIGSSIGNFSPVEATAVLSNLRAQLLPGDMLLLGTDLAPSPHKSVADLLAAYNDAIGITAAFDLNVLPPASTATSKQTSTSRASTIAPVGTPTTHASRCTSNPSPARPYTSPPTPQAPPSSCASAPAKQYTPKTVTNSPPAPSPPSWPPPLSHPPKPWHDPDGLFAVTLATAI